MTEFMAFSAFTSELARLMLTSSELPALRPALLLGLPVGGAAVVAAQGIGPMQLAGCCTVCETRFSCLCMSV